jgi:hypothetical protein
VFILKLVDNFGQKHAYAWFYSDGNRDQTNIVLEKPPVAFGIPGSGSGKSAGWLAKGYQRRAGRRTPQHHATLTPRIKGNRCGFFPRFDQLKNTRAALLDVALERSHWRRLVCARALGKMQQKAIKGAKIYWEIRSPDALSPKYKMNCCTQLEEQVEKGFA